MDKITEIKIPNDFHLIAISNDNDWKLFSDLLISFINQGLVVKHEKNIIYEYVNGKIYLPQ